MQMQQMNSMQLSQMSQMPRNSAIIMNNTGINYDKIPTILIPLEIIDVTELPVLSADQIKQMNIITNIITNTTSNIEYDASKLNVNDLANIDSELTDLKKLRIQYMEAKDDNNLTKVENRQKYLTQVIIDYKKYIDKNMKDVEEKIQTKTKEQSELIIQKNVDDKNTEIFALEIDPTKYNPLLKDVLYEIDEGKRIDKIILSHYNLPHNANNVTKYNNKFAFYTRNQLFKTQIAEGLYTIESLIFMIKAQHTFLNITVTEDNKIIISTTDNSEFDLMPSDDSIFNLLGFTKRAENYKGLISYMGEREYDLNVKPMVKFFLSGISPNMVELETNKDTVTDIVLKQYSPPRAVNKLPLKFLNHLEYMYDFPTKFVITFKIIYEESQ